MMNSGEPAVVNRSTTTRKTTRRERRLRRRVAHVVVHAYGIRQDDRLALPLWRRLEGNGVAGWMDWMNGRCRRWIASGRRH